MTITALKVIATAMQSLGIKYGFMEYKKKPIEYPYFIGEYVESTPMNEDGMAETSFTLTGYSRTDYATLETQKEKIRTYFDSVSGKTGITDGIGWAIYYQNAQLIPTWDEELKKVQITLHIKEWSV